MAKTKRSPWNLELLNEDRLRKGWTHSRLAALSGLHVATVSRFLSGKHRGPETAKKIADALGVDVGRYVVSRGKSAA